MIDSSDDEGNAPPPSAHPKPCMSAELRGLQPWSGWRYNTSKRPKHDHDNVDTAVPKPQSSAGGGSSTAAASAAQPAGNLSRQASGKQRVYSTGAAASATSASVASLAPLPSALTFEFAKFHNTVAKAMHEQTSLAATLQQELKQKDAELQRVRMAHNAELDRVHTAHNAEIQGRANDRARHNQLLANATDQAARERQARLEAEQELGTCVVCQDGRRVWMWNTCGHLLLCNNCHGDAAVRNSRSTCMICNREGRGYFRVRF